MQSSSRLRHPPALKAQGPTLSTLHMVEGVLRRLKRPVSLNRLKILLPRKVMHSTLRQAIEHYKRLGCLAEGSKGVLWVLEDDVAFWKAVEHWDRA